MLTAGRRTALMIVAAALVAAAIFLPLWGMTLASIQYPEGLRLVVYPTRIVGDVREINMLNGYIGMAKISRDFFVELRILPWALGAVALLTLGVAFARRWWVRALPLFGLVAIAAYGFRSMATRMYEYGHRLDPMAPIDIEPFTPPMFGENQIAQFGTYAYFSWGTFLPLVAGALIALVVWSDYRWRGERAPGGATHDETGPRDGAAAMARRPRAVPEEMRMRRYNLVPMLALGALIACGSGSERTEAAAADPAAAPPASESAGPSQADLDYEEITAGWTQELHDACGADLKEALGTRDLVAGVLSAVSDPDGRATAEIEDATHWMTEGNEALSSIRPELEGGACGDSALRGLEEAWQFYVKAGTSAVQASQMVGA